MPVVESPSSEEGRKKAKRLLAGFFSANEGGYRRVRGIFGIGKSCLIQEVFDTHARAEDLIKCTGDYRKLDVETVEETLLSILPPESLAKLGNLLIVQRRLKSSRLRLIVEEVQEAYGANSKLVILFSAYEIGNISKESLDIMSGDQNTTTLKWILEERSDLGPIPPPQSDPSSQPKPTLSRSDRDKVIPVDGWNDSEVRDFVASTFQSLLEGGEENKEAIKRIEDVVLLWAGGHPDLVSNVCKWLKDNLMIVKEHENHWRNALGSREALEEFIRVETEVRIPTLRGIVEEICEHLSPPTKSYVADMARNGGEIGRPAMFVDLRRVGLATQDSKLIRLLKLFHPNSVSEHLLLRELSDNGTVDHLRNKISAFLRSTWNKIRRAQINGEAKVVVTQDSYDSALKALLAFHDRNILTQLAEKIDTATKWEEQKEAFKEVASSLCLGEYKP